MAKKNPNMPSATIMYNRHPETGAEQRHFLPWGRDSHQLSRFLSRGFYFEPQTEKWGGKEVISVEVEQIIEKNVEQANERIAEIKNNVKRKPEGTICPTCGKTCASKAGLLSHIRIKHKE